MRARSFYVKFLCLKSFCSQTFFLPRIFLTCIFSKLIFGQNFFWNKTFYDLTFSTQILFGSKTFWLKFFGHGYFLDKKLFLTKTTATIITTTTFMGFDTIEINLVLISVPQNLRSSSLVVLSSVYCKCEYFINFPARQGNHWKQFNLKQTTREREQKRASRGWTQPS